MKLSIALFGISLIFIQASLFSQVFLYEGFENGHRPDGWTEEYVVGEVNWRYRNGGYNPSDPNLDNPIIPNGEVDIARNPPSAFEGNYNAFFFNQGDNNERTKLITPEMNMLGATAVELNFYLCQLPWTFEGSTGWDVLRVYYKISESDPWILLHEFLDPVYEWEKQTLNLPNPSETYYVAFEGHTRWGFGTCLDSVYITETGIQQLYVGDIEFEQSFSLGVPSGSPDVPVMVTDMQVYGNTGSLTLDQISFTSLNTSDMDLSPNGVKLYTTTTLEFNTNNQVGTPASFSGGEATFSGLNHNLYAGHNYLWLTYDVAPTATHKNLLDAMVMANHVVTSGGSYPATDQSPAGERMIYYTLYQDDFEGTLNWALSGEFQWGTPTGNGGNPGNPDPVGAYSGIHALGTDLTGLGANPYNYEPDLTEGTADLAVSENLNVLYYKDLHLFFRRHLNIEVWDWAAIEVSTDDGDTWNTVWGSNGYVNDFQWNQQKVTIPSQFWRADQLRMRFSMGPTSAMNNYSGWNIDDVYLTGEYISKDVGVSEWIYPQSGSGHTSSDSVTVRIRNYGGEPITDPVPVAYSFNGGTTWTINQMNADIPVNGSVDFTFSTHADLSQPGLRPSVIARTNLPGDQYTSNDQISTAIYIVPTYSPPYEEDFEQNDGYWRPGATDLWEYGTPAGGTIDNAASGSKSWVTGLSSTYGEMISDQNQIIFEDGFESSLGWNFSGEFQRAVPDGINLPWYAYEGYYCIGTDLSGQGDSLHLYENGITSGSAFTATSPPLDLSECSNLQLSFASWITIQQGDSIRLEVSDDNGSTWTTLWQNNGTEMMDSWYQQQIYSIPDELTFTDAFRIRFSLYYSSSSGPVGQGWSIDDILLTGDRLHTSHGGLVSPSFDLTEMQNPMIEANLWIETEEAIDGVNLQYSLDDGNSWSTVTNASGNDSYWNWYTGQSVSALGNNGWSGHTGQWIRVKHLLPASLASEANVQFSFNFAADKADNQYDGIAVDDVRMMEAPHDVDLLQILDPVSACELTSQQNFVLRMRNVGLATMQTGDSIRVGYYIERNGDIQTGKETLVLDQPLAAGSIRNFTMSEAFDFSESGEYITQVYLMTEDPHFYKELSGDTINQSILVNKPSLDLGADISTVRPDTVVLRAYSGISGQTYLWQDGSTDSLYSVSTDGTYHVTVTNGIGCQARDTIQVMQLIADLGISELVSPQSSCELGDPLPIKITIFNYGTDTVETGASIVVMGQVNQGLPFGDTILLNQRFKPGESFEFTYPGLFDFSVPGVYQLKLYALMNGDMVSTNDTLDQLLEVYGYPDSDLGPDTLVVASEYLLIPGSGYEEYLWQDGSAGETFLVTKPGVGLYHVQITDGHLCSSTDSVVVTLQILDLALEELLSPSTSCELSELITVSARFRNAGNQTIASGETVQLGYRIDGAPVVWDQVTLSQDLYPGRTIDFTFSQSETVQTGQWYDFTVFVDYMNDSKPFNDTIVKSVGVFETPVLDLGEEFQVVTELEYTLDAGPGFASYAWQDGSTSQTYTITQTGVGRYWVSVEDANGCSASDSVDVMLAVPDLRLLEITNPVTTCHLEAGEHVTVAVENAGNWDIEPGAAISVGYSIDGAEAVVEDLLLESTLEPGAVIHHTFSQSEDFSIPGRYAIMAYTEYASDLVPSNDIVLINMDHYGSPQVDIGMGQDTIVVYEPITLSATQGYPSYLWQDGSTETDYQITEPSQGMYSVVVTAENGCETHDSVYVAYDVPDLELIRIESPGSSCSEEGISVVSLEIANNGYFRIGTDDTLTISYSVDGGSSVIENISLESELLQGDSTIVTFFTGHDFSALGSYEIQASLLWTMDGNLSNNLVNSTIHIWGYPVVEIEGVGDTLFSNLPVTLDAGVGHTAYMWQDLSTGSSYEVTEPGLYWVMAMNEYGCTDTDSVQVFNGTAISKMNSLSGQVRIYPNPASDVLYVALEMEQQEEVRIELYSVANSLIYREDIRSSEVKEAHIDVHDLTPGTYLLRITSDEVPHTFKVIVE